MLEIHNFWGPQLWAHVTWRARSWSALCIALLCPRLKGISPIWAAVLIYPFLAFSFPALGECLLISLAAGPLPLCLFLSVTSVKTGSLARGDSLAESFQNAACHSTAVSAGSCSRWAGFGPYAVWGPFLQCLQSPVLRWSQWVFAWVTESKSIVLTSGFVSVEGTWTAVMLQRLMLLESWTFGLSALNPAANRSVLLALKGNLAQVCS